MKMIMILNNLFLLKGQFIEAEAIEESVSQTVCM